MGDQTIELKLCSGTGCGAGGAFRIKETLILELEKQGLLNRVKLGSNSCVGLCGKGPVMEVLPDGIFYGRLATENIPAIIEEHFKNGKVYKKFLIKHSNGKTQIPLLAEVPFYKKQKLLIFRNKGIIDPEEIDDYLGRDGYLALEKALTTLKPQQVINEITKSGLRGRGGGGFPTGAKWQICYNEKKTPKYIIGNCDEGDPGAYMDRSLIESDPHVVIEGMILAAYAVNASQGYLYIRSEYPLAIDRMYIAISQAANYGLLGKNILGTEFDFQIEIREGSGAFICGEETSLIHSIEGENPEPRQRPPFPVQEGIWGCPTVINNVETLANVPLIINRSAKWYSNIGTKTSKGTKIFSLVGKIENTGLIEVPMGITLREIIYEIGGGIPNNKKFKALQTGGPSGGCIPQEFIDLPVDYESLKETGSMMGSGGMIVLDEDTCMVDVAKFFIQFTNDESCGKCSTCRDGSQALLEVLTRITEGDGKEGDIEFLEEMSQVIKDTSMCGLGITLPNPVFSTLNYFKDEYVAHINAKRCPALLCKSLIKYYILADKCIGCLLCLKNCPAEAIRGELKHIHLIDQSMCTKCGECLLVCPAKVSAVIKLSGEEARNVQTLASPIPIKKSA